MPRVNKDSTLWQQAYKAHKVKNLSPKKYATQTKRKEPMALYKELLDVKAQLKILRQRKKHLEKALKDSSFKRPRPEYMDKTIKLYALLLEDNCYYIGMTRNMDKRFAKHIKGTGANWTKLHRALSIVEIRETNNSDDDKVALLENDMTVEYALKYGKDKVRGGGYCQSKPRWPDVVIQS